MPQENVSRFFAAVLRGEVSLETDQLDCTSSPERFSQLSIKYGFPFTVPELQAEIASHLKKPQVIQLFQAALKDEALKHMLKQASHPMQLNSALQPLGYRLTPEELNAVIYSSCHCVRDLWCEYRAGGLGKIVFEQNCSVAAGSAK